MQTICAIYFSQEHPHQQSYVLRLFKCFQYCHHNHVFNATTPLVLSFQIAQERNRQLEEENAKVPDKNSRSLFEQAEQLSALETSVQRARQRLATWHQQGLETSLAATIPVASVSILTPSMENLEPAAERKAGIPEVGEPTEGSLATKHHFAAVVDNIEASFGAYFAEVGQVLGELAKNNVSKGSGKELEAGVPGGPKGQAQAAGVEDDVLQAQIADLQAQIDALTEGAERMQADLAVSAKQTLFLEREVAEKDVQTAALRAEAGALPGLKADLTAAEEHALALQTKLALTANELFRLEAASASQSADLSSAKGQVSALTLDLTARDERITSLLAELETLRAAAAESIKSAEALKAELAVARDAEVAARDAEVATERVARDFEQIAAELEIAARASEQRFAEVERKCAEQAGLILALREQVSVAGGSEGERELPVGISAATDVNAARENGGQGDKGVGLEVNVKAIGQEDSAGASRKVAEEGDETVGSLAEKEMDAIGVAEGEIANRARSEGAVESELPAESEDRTTETQGSFPGQEILHVARDEEAGERTERELRTARDAAEDRAALLEEENVRLVAAVDYVSLENERLVEAIEEERERFAVKMDTLQVEEERLRKALEEESERWEGKVKRLLLENEGLRDGNEEDSARFESEIKERDNERAQLREEIARCAAELEALSAENEALLKRLVEERAKSVGEAEDLRKMVGEERARFANETEVLLFAEERLRADLEEERARFAEQIEGFAHEKAALIAENEEQKQRFDSEMEVVLLENERLKEALETANEQTQAALHELERAGRNQGGTRAEQERAELEVRVRELERACALAQADAERMEAGWREASIRAGELEEKVLGLKRSLYEKEAQLKEAVARAEKLALRGVTGRRVSGDVETETFGRDIATSVPPGKGEGVSVSPGGGSLGIAIALPSTEGIPLEHSPADSRSVSVAGVSDGSESPVTVPGARALLEALGIDSAQSSPSLVSTPPAEEGSPGFHDLVNGQLGFVLSGGANRLLSSGKLIHMDSLDAPARSPGRATGHVAAWDSALEAMTPGGVQFVGPVVQHSGEMAEGDQVEISLSPGGDVSDFGSPVWSGRRVSGSIRKASGR